MLETTRHDFYHLPGYVALCGDVEGGDPRALLVETDAGAMLMPLLIRPVPGTDLMDAGSPYGYPSPLFACAEGAEEDVFSSAWPCAARMLLDQKIVSVFVRLHPILHAPLSALAAAGTVVSHGETVSMDLRLDDEEALAQMRSTSRNEIRRALRIGNRARCDERWEHLDTFVSMYSETMRRVAADSYYLLPRSYFVRLKEVLGSKLELWVVEIGSDIAAAALITFTGTLVEYHLSASSAAFAKQEPTKLLLDAARRSARTRGCLDFHLGGGVGSSSDSLFFFKAGLSRRRHRFRTWRVVIDPHAYERLRPPDSRLESDAAAEYFPSYRRRRGSAPP